MTMAEKILVVEDERNIASFVAMYLKNARYQVDIARDGGEALQKADSLKPDLVVLDLMLPDIDGLEVCRQIRSTSDVPILMVTARDDDVDKIVGLELGADDYLTKPFNPRELVARIKAVLRRSESGKARARILRVADLDIDLDRREARIAGERVQLRPKEFDLPVLATLLLAGTASVFILPDYQIRRETNRVAELALPLSNQVRSLEQFGTSTQEIVDYLERQADELDLRLVLADSRGIVFADTEDSLIGRQLQIENQVRFGLRRRVRQASVQGPDGELSFMVSPAIGQPNPQNPSASPTPPPGASVGVRFLGRQSAYIVGLSVAQQSVATAWLELLPRLSLAALAALLLSTALAW